MLSPLKFQDRYLDTINSHAHEKMQLFEYMKERPEGIFLDIGAWWLTVQDLLLEVPNSPKLMYLAGDLTQGVLDKFAKNNPRIAEYIPNEWLQKRMNGMTVWLQKMNATNLNFADQTISGINVSAVVHEVVSYCWLSALQTMVKECMRVLEPQWVLVYRDPLQCLRPQEFQCVEIKSKPFKIFSMMFLPVFIWKRKTNVITTYERDNIIFTRFENNESKEGWIDQLIYKNLQSVQRDKNMTLTAPRWILQELHRHYLTFLRDYAPDVLNGTKKSSSLRLNWALKKVTIDDPDHDLEAKWKDLIDDQAKWSIVKLKTGYSMDFKVLLMVYPALVQENKKNIGFWRNIKLFVEWYAREWQEWYYYATIDQRIAFVAEHSLQCDQDVSMVLCPNDLSKIQSHPRPRYTQLINEHFKDVIDPWNELFHDDKCSIHFKKTDIHKAYFILSSLCDSRPGEFIHIQQFVQKTLRPIVYRESLNIMRKKLHKTFSLPQHYASHFDLLSDKRFI